MISSILDKRFLKKNKITKRRRLTQSLFLLLYFLFPLLNIFYIDIEKTSFVLLGKTIGINNSIIFLLAFIILLLSVITMSILSGRSFCGWICPQNFLSEIINKIINNLAIKNNKKNKLVYFIITSFSFLFSLLVATNFLFYFGKTENIFYQIINFNLNSTILIFGIFFFLIVFLGIGIFRHDFCKYACPYGIMQAAVSDKTTIKVRFEKERAKDCIDCGACKDICYMNIEPRKLYQDDPGCMNCGLCIEACNSVLEPINRKTMLTFSRIKADNDSINNKAFLILPIMLVSFIIYFFYLFIYLPDIDINVSRDESIVSVIDRKNNINSRFIITLLNQSDKEKNINLIAENINNKYIEILPKNIHIKAGEKYTALLNFKAPKNLLKKGINKFIIKVLDDKNKEINKTYNSIFVPFD
jgi:polyferredoxin